VTKIMGERAVLESNIKHWASLRQTFIMIPDVMSLMDPIMFHQPINSFMENNTNRDAGRGLINCLDIPDDSDFWKRVYNMAGGPSCRITFYEFMNKTMEMNGVGNTDDVAERKWFALRNFHMQFYEDSWILNEYIHNWGDSVEDYLRIMKENRPSYIKFAAWLSGKSKRFKKIVQNTTRKKLKKLALDKTGTLYWYENKKDMRISAFYKDYDTYDAIPDWGIDMPQINPRPEWKRLDHGYDEQKGTLNLEDLKGAASFRGGQCLSSEWDGDLYSTLTWKCAFDHEFKAKPFTIIKAGHWCPECLAPPWNYDEIAKKNPFFAQVWYPNHDKNEHNFYPEDCYLDIAD
ncbi:MAG: NAD(P)-dependent oxidoreductase, partial [Promethearchaeota archaeon]